MYNNYFFEKERKTMQRERRNNTIKDILGALLFFVIVMGGAGLVGTIETTYYSDGIILSSHNGKVIVEDARGEAWEFYGTGYNKGDEVRVRFNTNGTDRNRQDDEVINVKKKNLKKVVKNY